MAIKDRDKESGKITKAEGGGRIKGARNLLQAEFLSDAVRSWRDGGAAVFEIIKKENPIAYARIMASVIPKELLIDDARKIESMTDDEIADLIARLKRPDRGGDEQAPGDSRGRTTQTLN